MSLELAIIHHEDLNATVISASGLIEKTSVEDFKTAIEDEIGTPESRKPSPPNLVMDFSQLRYINSQGLSQLAFTYEALGQLRLAGTTPQIARVLEIVGFSEILSFFDSQEAALEDIQNPPQPSA